MPGSHWPALYEIGQLLNSIREPDLLLEPALDQALRTLGGERGLLLLVGTTGELEVRVARGIAGPFEKELSALAQTTLHEILSRREGRLCLGAPDAIPAAPGIIIPPVRSIACVPLMFHDRVIGAIYVDRRTDRTVFSDESLAFLKALAGIVALALENARRHQALVAENTELRAALREWRQFPEIVGASPALTPVFELMNRVIPTDVPVLITGETGTGKELIARAVHFNGPRGKARFVPVNCSAIPEHLIETELFGCCRGAFTGAATDRQGLLETAHHGTIFLDEIGDLPLALQPRLLRVLQDGEVRRVGDTSVFNVDIRVISATHHDLPALVKSGEFREDLYCQLNVIPLELPPLRYRREDIPSLAHHFLQRCATRMNKPVVAVAPDALAQLLNYPWPGNIRQLENVIERAVVLCAGTRVTAADIMFPTGIDALRTDASRAEIEKHIVLERLKQFGGNRSRTAESLGISRRTLHNWMTEWKVQFPV